MTVDECIKIYVELGPTVFQDVVRWRGEERFKVTNLEKEWKKIMKNLLKDENARMMDHGNHPHCDTCVYVSSSSSDRYREINVDQFRLRDVATQPQPC